MQIESMTERESIDLLSRSRLGHLACANSGQPYITPVYFSYESNYLYSFSTLGRKVEWMRANALVCVEVDEIVSAEEWASVIVFGRYEELTQTPNNDVLRRHAHALLQKNPLWWEPGYVKTVLHGEERSLELVYFRINMTHISGHRGIPSA